MLHAEEPTKYQLEFDEYQELIKCFPELGFDLEVEAQIAAKIFCAFVKTYGKDEGEPYQGGLWNLLNDACEYSGSLITLLHDKRRKQRKRMEELTNIHDIKSATNKP